MSNSKDYLIAEQRFYNRSNHTPHAYIDITGDLATGTLFSQIMYWFSLNENGEKRVKVHKEGQFWLAKRREDWWGEIRISPKQYDRSIKVLQELNFVEVKTFKFNGVPTTHIRPLYENIKVALDNWKAEQVKEYQENETGGKMEIDERGNSKFTFGEYGNLPLGNMEIDERGNSLTEITNNNITTNITNNNNIIEQGSKKSDKKQDVCPFFEELWKMYPRKMGKSAVSKSALKEINKVGYDDMVKSIENYKADIQKNRTTEQYILHGSTFFNGRYKDYLPGNYEGENKSSHTGAYSKYAETI